MSSHPKRTDQCPRGRNGHRYFKAGAQCRLRIPRSESGGAWDRDWDVSFVDTEAGLARWLVANASGPLAFDAEWSRGRGAALGTLQLASTPSQHEAVVVDCTRGIGRSVLAPLFQSRIMVGFATNNDVRRLEIDVDDVDVDLQTLAIFGKPVDWKTGQPKQQWGLDDLAHHVLGYEVKVAIGRHPQWSSPSWQFKDSHIHYAANDAIAASYIGEASAESRRSGLRASVGGALSPLVRPLSPSHPERH